MEEGYLDSTSQWGFPMVRLAAVAVGFVLAGSMPGFAQEDGQIYRIKSRLSDKVLAPSADGTLLVQTTERPRAKNQRWKLVKAGPFFQIVNMASGKVITAPSKEALDQLTLTDNNKKEKARIGQLWSFSLVRTRYTIQSRHSDLYLDVYDYGKEDGVKIIQQVLNGKPGSAGNQVWQLIPVK